MQVRRLHDHQLTACDTLLLMMMRSFACCQLQYRNGLNGLALGHQVSLDHRFDMLPAESFVGLIWRQTACAILCPDFNQGQSLCVAATGLRLGNLHVECTHMHGPRTYVYVAGHPGVQAMTHSSTISCHEPTGTIRGAAGMTPYC